MVIVSRFGGGIIAKSAPPEYTRAIMDYLVSQVRAFFECYRSSISDMEDAFIRFTNSSLYGCRSGGLILIAITEAGVDMEALRIASELCLRHASSLIPDEESVHKDLGTSIARSVQYGERTPNHKSSEHSFSIHNGWEKITQFLGQADTFIAENPYTVRVYRYGYFRALDMTPIQVIISRVAIDPLFNALQRTTAQKLLEALNRYEATAWTDFERLLKEAIAVSAQFEQTK